MVEIANRSKYAGHNLGHFGLSLTPSSEPHAEHGKSLTETGGRPSSRRRRLAERGVRFVQLYHRGGDTHGAGEGDDLKHVLPAMCRQVDQAALVKDLKQRGMLDETIVVWGGEFGRTPMNEGRGGSPYPGRDHHPKAFTMWMAGGGIKPGLALGATDELGYSIAQDPVRVHGLHATLLHLLGLDYTKLTFRSQGRYYRLTDVYGNVVTKLLA